MGCARGDSVPHWGCSQASRQSEEEGGTLQGLGTRGAKDARHTGPLAASVSVCAAQLTQLDPVYNSERIFSFFLVCLAGCFTFRSLNKQEIKRTSNKWQTELHILPHSAGKLSVSLWGMGVPASVPPWTRPTSSQPFPFILRLWKNFLFNQHGEPFSSAPWKPDHYLTENIRGKKRERES